MSWSVLQGDCIERMAEMEEASVDAIVCDPPYGLEFMGATWDGADGFRRSLNPADVDRGNAFGRASRTSPEYKAGKVFEEWCERWATEALRVLKPGGHLLAFGGTRTYHRLACAIEDAGFEIRDSILAWGFGSGFPKSRRVNADPRFCQCGEAAHSDEYIDPEPLTADHTYTEDASLGGDPRPEDAHRSTHTPSDSPGDCLPDRDSGGGPAHPDVAGGPTSPPPQEDAQARSRSSERGGAGGSESSRSPSPARRNGPPANTDSTPPHSRPTENGKRSSSKPAPRTGSGSESPVSGIPHKGEFPSAFPHCTNCGRPNADGFGTALKPAFEPIVVARKPLIGTVAENVLQHGTGGINVDACRIEANDTQLAEKYASVQAAGRRENSIYGSDNRDRLGAEPHIAGRWPANVVLSEEAAEELDAQSGESQGGAGGMRMRAASSDLGVMNDDGWEPKSIAQPSYADSGGASRFFYCAKTSRGERNAGLEGFEEVEAGNFEDDAYEWKTDGHGSPRKGPIKKANHHPTVKPIKLMRWLCRLVTPPGGLILDPFLGSGTTGCAAVLEGFDFIGVEREGEYLAIAEARIAFWAQHVAKEVDEVLGNGAKARKEAAEHAARGQLTIE